MQSFILLERDSSAHTYAHTGIMSSTNEHCLVFIAALDLAPHGGPVHDAQLDHHGKRLATASADQSIRIWDVSTERPSFVAELKGHAGPVWQKEMGMSHEGGADGGQGENWQLVYESQDHGASVNGVAWAPWQYGPYLASASSDGKIGILHHSPADQQWVRTEFHAHTNGVNAVSWAPSGPATHGPSLGPMRMVSGGADNQVKLWQYDDRSQKWVELAGIDAENGHTDVIRDVAWRPNIVGAPSSTIASCSEDKTVIIWTQEMEGQPWKKAQVIQLDGPVRRVDWSVSGSLLAVACADKQVLLYKENLQGKWEEMITNLSHTQAPPPLQQQQHGQPEELLPAAPPEGWLPGDERRVPMWAYLMRGERDLRDGDTDDQAAAHRMQQVLAFGGVKLQQSEDTGAGRGDTNTNDDDTNDTKHKPAMLRGEEKSDTTKGVAMGTMSTRESLPASPTAKAKPKQPAFHAQPAEQQEDDQEDDHSPEKQEGEEQDDATAAQRAAVERTEREGIDEEASDDHEDVWVEDDQRQHDHTVHSHPQWFLGGHGDDEQRPDDDRAELAAEDDERPEVDNEAPEIAEVVVQQQAQQQQGEQQQDQEEQAPEAVGWTPGVVLATRVITKTIGYRVVAVVPSPSRPPTILRHSWLPQPSLPLPTMTPPAAHHRRRTSVKACCR
ncbi:unnamed protein product [Vitrella brassicaformis CCMP3155]|uniref:Uncharacterized protein n=1 Tax=Vitrella brassicaformis (strain CCMP3155) TaxID=1169540 RepID=A0A0G4ER51_VITBC|nr:unnamed protein product [Vitrella brassicaformis CCMP3155]|eukprot:CEL99736.1 unnamed protein product [Vitrella brassicaformis CCMP3155]